MILSIYRHWFKDLNRIPPSTFPYFSFLFDSLEVISSDYVNWTQRFELELISELIVSKDTHSQI